MQHTRPQSCKESRTAGPQTGVEFHAVMAELKKALASLVECPICLGNFTDPRMLVCLHTLCYQCLSDYIRHNGKDGHFQCPVCRKKLQIPDGGADDFPKNFFINNCTALVTDTGTGARSKTTTEGSDRGRGNLCNLCEEEESCQFCTHCCEYYCRACSRAHSKMKATCSHEQVAVEDLTDELLREATAKADTPRCSKHRKKLKLYCGTCQCAICSACFPVSHQSHAIREIADVDVESKSEIGEAVRIIKTLTGSIEDQCQRVNKSRENVNSNTSSAIATTRDIFQKMHKMLDKKTKEIDKKINKDGREALTRDDVLSKNLTLNLTLVQSFCTFLEDLQTKGTALNRLACLPEVRSRLRQFQGSSEDLPQGAEIHSSSDLLVQHLDGLVMRQEITVGGTGPRAGRPVTVEMVLKCSIKDQTGAPQEMKVRTLGAQVVQHVARPATAKLPQKLSVVVYRYGDWYMYVGSVVEDAVASLPGHIQCQVTLGDSSKQLQPLTSTSGHTQVDVIVCEGDQIHSVVKTFSLNRLTATGRRNLCLVHRTGGGGSITETRDTLGADISLFQCVIHWDWNSPDSIQTATATLREHLLRLATQPT